MTWGELAQTGRGRIVLTLEILGWPYVFTSCPCPISDSWFTDAHYEGIIDWLVPTGIELGDLIRPLEGFGDTPGITFQLADIDGELTGELGDYKSGIWSRLAEPVFSTDFEIVVLDATGFPPSGVIWLGQEAIHYPGRDGTTFYADYRGYYGTTPRDYPVDYTQDPPISAVVSAGPRDIRGRPCRLHAAEITDGIVGPTTVIYRGFIDALHDIGEGSWSVPTTHCQAKVFDRRVGADLPSVALLTSYFYSGDPSSVSVVVYQQVGVGGAGVTFKVVVSGFYSSQESLARVWNEEALALGSTIKPQLYRTGNRWGLYAPANSAVNLAVTCREGDPLWALGFNPGTFVQDRNVIWRREADEDPRPVVVDWTTGYSPQVAVSTTYGLSSDLFAAIPGHPFAKIFGFISDSVVFYGSSQDQVREEPVWVVEKDEPENMRLSHVFAFSGDPNDPDTLLDAVQRALGLLPGQAEPERWCAFGLTEDDIDFYELEAALVGAPVELRFFYDAVIEGTAFKDLFGPRFGILGIAPRITSEGRIGFARIETPTELVATDVPVDAEVWSLVEAARVKARLGGDPLVTQVKVAAGYDYRTKKWPKPSEINWDDGVSERGDVRSLNFQLRGIAFSETLAHLPSSIADFEGPLRTWLRALVYGLFGRMTADLAIPSTWTSRQFRCGDIVRITHPLLPDVTEGRIGVTERLGIIIGVRHAVTDDGPDLLTVKIPPRAFAGGIGPCARATGWNPGTLTMSFPDADAPLYAAPGRNDLDEYYPLMYGTLWEYDVIRPSVGWPKYCQIDTLDIPGKTVTLVSDPFTPDPFPTFGVWLTFGVWADQSPEDREFVSIADTDYLLGGSYPGFEWAV